MAFVAVLLLSCSLASLFLYLYTSKRDTREPVFIPQRLPLVGHILGLLRHGHFYLELQGHDLPIYTLQTFNTRIYVVNSPELVAAVERNMKNISFTPFVVAMLPRLFNVSDHDIAIASRNHDEADGHWGYMRDVHSTTYSVLAPGKDLDYMVKLLLEGVLTYTGTLSDDSPCRTIEIDLFTWIRRVLTVTSTSAVYGPENPFLHNLELETAFWDFKSQLARLLLGVMPNLTARKAHRGRARIAAAMQRYFERGGQDKGGGLVQTRYEVAKKHGLSTEAMSVFELGNCIGVLINSVPTTFWLLYHIFSSPDLLSSIREELSSVITSDPATDATIIPAFKVQELCPILMATYREVLRYRTHSSTSRYVRRETLLANQYILKQDSIIQIPSAVIHTNPEIWGADAKVFNPYRFLRASVSGFSSTASLSDSMSGSLTPASLNRSGSSSGSGSLTPVSVSRRNLARSDHSSDAIPVQKTFAMKKTSFRAFGGGATLCPGRHFATTTILSIIAMMVLRFDITPVEGEWPAMAQAKGRLASTLPPPDGDIKVRVRERLPDGDKGEDGKRKWKWDFEGRVPRFES